MADFALLLPAAALVNHVVLGKLPDQSAFTGGSRRLDQAYAVALATGFVLMLSSALSWIAQRWLLAPLGLDPLRALAWILAPAVVVTITTAVMRRLAPPLYGALGLLLPLIAANGAVLGVALLDAQSAVGLFEAIVLGGGAAIGFGLVLVMFAAMRERLEQSDVPAGLRGTPIALVTAALMALAFRGFAGMASG